MKTPVIGLLLIVMMKREGEKEATATTTTKTSEENRLAKKERQKREVELERIGNEELEGDIADDRVADITNLLITELTNKPNTETMNEGLRMLKNPKIEKRLKTHTGNQVQELKSRARTTVQLVELNVIQDTEAPQDFTISVIDKGKKIYLKEMTRDKFPGVISGPETAFFRTYHDLLEPDG